MALFSSCWSDLVEGPGRGFPCWHISNGRKEEGRLTGSKNVKEEIVRGGWKVQEQVGWNA